MGNSWESVGKARVMLRALCWLLALAFVLLPTALRPALADASEQTDKPSKTSVQMELFSIDKYTAKLTLYQISDLLAQMRKDAEDYQQSFRYRVVLSGARDIELHGKIRYTKYEGSTEDQITWISTELSCKNIPYDVQHPIVEENKLSWIIKFPKWMNFDANDLKDISFKIYNAYDTRQAYTQSFVPPETLTTTILRTDLVSGSGSMTIEVPDGQNMIIRIKDPDLKAGYKNSTGGKGTLEPVWHVKVVYNSYMWFEMSLDGSQGKSQNGMDFYAGEFHLDKNESNKYKAQSVAVENCSYSIEGDTLVLHFTAPASFPNTLQYMQWLQVDSHNGAISHKYKIL